MNRPALALVDTPPASPEAVARMIAAAKASGRALSLDLASKAKTLAADALMIASLGDAVLPGVRDDAGRTAAVLVAFAERVERLAK